MSERMTNVDIEDILSSIRRLVSEEARPPLVRQPPRLVLTPADRVDPVAAVPEPLPHHRSASEDALEARIAELEAMLGGPAAGFEPDEGDPFDTPPAVPRIAPNPGAAGSAAAPEPQRPAPREAQAAAKGGEAPVFSHRRARSPGLDLVSPDVPAADPPAARGTAAHRAAAHGAATHGAATHGAAAHEAAAHEAPPKEPALAEASSAPREFEKREAEWEAVGPDAFHDLGEPGDLIDEETLREMVRDILRDELQGALGERITRNVRKLVRAEIARALASRDL